jgi:hypothetical protein
MTQNQQFNHKGLQGDHNNNKMERIMVRLEIEKKP